MERKDELSIVMLIDKLQDMEGFADIGREVSTEYLKEVTAGTPGYLLDIIAQVMEVLLSKLNVPYEEAATFTEQIKERRMGELLANFKGYDVQATRQKAKAEERENGISKLIEFGIKHGISKEDILKDLAEQYFLDAKEALKRIEEH